MSPDKPMDDEQPGVEDPVEELEGAFEEEIEHAAELQEAEEAGTKRLASETGAGQWGSSLALACRLFGLECNVYMVKVS